MDEDYKNLFESLRFTSLLRKGKMHEPMKGNGYDGMESDSFAQLVNVSVERVLL